MALTASDNQGRDDPALAWETPSDIRLLIEMCPVASKRFSIELLKMRMPNMDEQTLKRAIKVISSLKTGNALHI